MREVITVPAIIRRRTRAAAGALPPQRPRAARLAASAVAAGLAVAAAGCGSGHGAASAAGSVFTIRQQVSLPQVQDTLSALYRSHPDLASFTVQDVSYTARSRATVMRECTSAPAAATAAASAESGQLIACAPLIFFLYSYGKQEKVPAAVTAAGQLYWYAVSHIGGPLNARSSLDAVLRSWKLPVAALSPTQARNAAEAAVLSATNRSMLAQRSVHLVITGRKPGSVGPAERIVADVGMATGTETIRSGAATATIRVTAKNAYFSGTQTGLTTFIGLPATAARRAGSRWVDIKAGSAEYQDLAAEDTMSSLPASILPGSGDTVQMRSATRNGHKVYILTWKATASGSNAAISEELVLSAVANPLPISETTRVNGNVQTVTLSGWGQQFAVPVPPSALPYTQVKG